jgi:hypothetical protein
VKRVLRDPQRYFHPATFREAFQDVVDVLAFHYQLDPVISPHDAHFRERLGEFLRVDPWTPLRDLYEEELLDAVLARGPEAVGICVAFPEQGVDAVLHTAWNPSDQPKAILLLDFAPPPEATIALGAEQDEVARQKQIDRDYYSMLR